MIATETTIEIDDNIAPEEIIAPHEVRDSAKVAHISESMDTNGWTGRPLLVLDNGNGKYALTGTHRLAAAVLSLYDVPVVYVDEELLETSGYTLSDLYDDEISLAIFQEIGDEKSAELMLAEINAN